MTAAKKAAAKKTAAKSTESKAKAQDETPKAGDDATPGVSSEGIARAGTTAEQIEAAEAQRKANEEADAERFANAAIASKPVELEEGGKVKESLYKSLEASDELVVVTKDIVEEFYFPDTKRPSSRLLFTKGQVVRKADIDAHNARAAAAAE
jgi:hypothetical protein